MNIDLDKILKAGMKTGAQLADTAKQTATDLAQKGKKQMDLMNAQTRLTKAQRQLGALVYSLAKNGEENDLLVKKYVEAIGRIEEEIEELKKDPENQPPVSGGTYTYTYTAPEAEPGKKKCPQCGSDVDEDALFCNSCGAQL